MTTKRYIKTRFSAGFKGMSSEYVDTVEEMKNRLCALFHRQISSQNMSYEGTRRKLILHFDVNKTVVPVDTATGEKVEDSLNVYLSGLAWGKDNKGVWEESSPQLSPKPKDKNDVSFYKFEEKRLLQQITEDRSVFRFHLQSFTDRPQGSNFKPYLDTLLEKLRWLEPYDDNIHRGLTISGHRYPKYHFILPSFIKLLQELIQTQREFAIIFRTFGNDAINVLSALKAAFTGAINSCVNMQPYVSMVTENVLTLQRDCNGLFHLGENTTGGPRLTGSEADMYSYFRSSSGISAIQDDVHMWYKNKFHPTHGKPLWIDLNDFETQHIFFDDNIRPGSDDSIVDLRLRENSQDFRKFRAVERAEEYQFVDANLAQVNFVDAIMNEDYYIDKLRICEENYSSILHSHHMK